MKRKKLSEIAEIVGGGTPKTGNAGFWDGDIVWLTPTDLPPLGEIAVVSDSARRITEDGLRTSSAQLLPPNTVSYSSRATIGKIGVSSCEYATNQGFTNFVCRDGVAPKYLAYALLHHTPSLERLSHSTAFKEIGKSAFSEFEIAVPDEKRQHQVIDILDQANALRRNRREAKSLRDRALTSVFHRMFGDVTSANSPWRTLPLSECGTFVSGATPPKGQEQFREGGVFRVTPKDMKTPNIFESAIRTSATALAEANQEVIQPGHVLLVVRGMALVRHLPVAINRVPVMIDRNMKAILPIDDLSPEFLRSCLQWLEPTILARVGTTGHGPKRFGEREMAEVRIPLPPGSLQDRFSSIVRELEALDSSQNAAAQDIENLFQTLLVRAFDGRLFSASGIRETQAGMLALLQELEHQTKA